MKSSRGMHLTEIGDGVVLLEPTEGLDPSDPDGYLTMLLEFFTARRPRRLIYDLRSVAVIDSVMYDWLKRVSGACAISDVEMVAVNIRPEAAFALARRLDGGPPFRCALDVDRARTITTGSRTVS